MAFFFSGDEAHRTYLITRSEDVPAYRSFATRLKRLAVHVRVAARCIDDVAFRAVTLVDRGLHRMIEALARSKTRRIQRELALRGVSYSRLHGNGSGRRDT